MSVVKIKGELFEWDDEKAKVNFKKHGITFNTVAKVFGDSNRIDEIDFLHSITEERRRVIGKVGKILFVVYTKRSQSRRIISARLATEKEKVRIMTVSKVIDVTAPLTEDEIAEIAALDGRIPEPDEDSPEMTDEEIAFYDYLHRKYKTRRIDKEMIMKEMAYLLEIFHKRQEIL